MESSAGPDRLAARLAEAEERIEALNRIGIALSAERDVGRLLEKILSESRRFTRSEAGSLYLLEETDGEKRLRFKLAQNEAIPVTFTERTMPVDETSLAGWVALRCEPLILDDAYAIPAAAPYRHNDFLDASTGWRTHAALVVPMCDHTGELVGVIQLMNRQARDGSHEPYPAELVPIVLSLATQGAVCLQASRLTAGIRKLFEDFARAAIFAVEQRDPSTAGHSARVARMAEALARLVDRASDGPYRDVHFSPDELREIRTAALLHDIGKLTVPERILLKDKKLDAASLQRIRDRFDLALEAEDAASYRTFIEKLVAVRAAPVEEDLRRFAEERRTRTDRLETEFEEVLRANEPEILPAGGAERVQGLRNRKWRNGRGYLAPLLLEDEARALSIERGSLSEEERAAVEGHVLETFRFLSSIPWTPDLKRVPEIAYAHHEKLDGSGYPLGLRAAQIPLPSQILAICDVCDALTAYDRPYKASVTHEVAAGILQNEVLRGFLDPWLVETFVREQVWSAALA